MTRTTGTRWTPAAALASAVVLATAFTCAGPAGRDAANPSPAGARAAATASSEPSLAAPPAQVRTKRRARGDEVPEADAAPAFVVRVVRDDDGYPVDAASVRLVRRGAPHLAARAVRGVVRFRDAGPPCVLVVEPIEASRPTDFVPAVVAVDAGAGAEVRVTPLRPLRGRLRHADGTPFGERTPVTAVSSGASWSSRTTRTTRRDPDVFRFELPAGKWSIEAEDSVYGPFDAGETDLDVVLRPALRVGATVRDAPAARARTAWFARRGGAPGAAPHAVSFAQDARFESPPLDAGHEVDVVVRLEQFGGDGAWALAPSIRPGAPDLDLVARPGRIVRGRAFRTDGAPVPAGLVVEAFADLRAGLDGTGAVATTDADGRFEIRGAPPFDACVAVLDDAWLAEPVRVAESDAGDVVLRVVPAPSISARVVFPDGSPAFRLVDVETAYGTRTFPLDEGGSFTASTRGDRARLTWRSGGGAQSGIELGEVSVAADAVRTVGAVR